MLTENIILGIIQGVAEWLPISSEGLFVLVKVNIFKSSQGLELLVRESLFLHLGTFFSVLIYFRHDIYELIKTIFNYRIAKKENQQILKFLIITTIISGLLGFLLLKFADLLLEKALSQLTLAINLVIGSMLLITGWLCLRIKDGGYRKAEDLEKKDSILLGLAQGLAVLPGLSRSGLTIAGLLLRKFDDSQALRLSFLMSLPIVLAGNVLLNLNQFILDSNALTGLFFAFIFGLITINLLLKLAKKINFGYFAIIFGLLVILSIWI